MAPTPHINANIDDFAPTVLMPGDPNRSAYIARNFLNNAKLINDVRGVKGFTGEYKKRPVTVMASGMGMPSMAIYSHELYNFFNVKNIIRIGSCGAIGNINLNEVVIAQKCVTDSALKVHFNKNNNNLEYCAFCSKNLYNKAISTAKNNNINIKPVNILTSDIFYNNKNEYSQYINIGVDVVDMETAALYLTAEKFNLNALAMFTVSDNIIKDEHLTSNERETSFNNMITLALNTAINL